MLISKIYGISKNKFLKWLQQKEHQEEVKNTKKKEEKNGYLFLSAKKMKVCRKEIKYSDKTIKLFVEIVAKPALKGKKKMIGDIYKWLHL
jgi:RNA binding exosome subunit